MEKQEHYKCKRCGRRIKNIKSSILGYGPTCYAKHLKECNRCKIQFKSLQKLNNII